MGHLAIEQRASIPDPFSASAEYGLCVDCGHDHPFAFLRDDSPETVCLKCMQRRLLTVFVPADI